MATRPNNPKRNHHILPKLYLKGFVIKTGEPYLWLYKRGEPYNPGNGKITNNPYKDTIRFAGMERDFYADPKEDGSKDFDTFEDELQCLEKPADPIFEKLRAKKMLSKDEKEVFSLYIVQMSRRVQRGRAKVKELAESFALGYEPSPKLINRLRALGADGTPDLRASIKEIANKIARSDGFDVRAHNRIAVASPGSFLIEVINRMTWTFYIARGGQNFVTGDNPIFIPEQLGLGMNISELSFPISSDVALVGSWNRNLSNGFVEAPPQILKEVNRRTITAASRYVYSCQNGPWVVTVMGKRNYKYQPMFMGREIYPIATLERVGPNGDPHVVWKEGFR